jgi:hypothetical protein
MKKKNIGSSFDDWLREEGLYEQATAVAVKRVLERAPKVRPIPALGERGPLRACSLGQAAQGISPTQAPEG